MRYTNECRCFIHMLVPVRSGSSLYGGSGVCKTKYFFSTKFKKRLFDLYVSLDLIVQLLLSVLLPTGTV